MRDAAPGQSKLRGAGEGGLANTAVLDAAAPTERGRQGRPLLLVRSGLFPLAAGNARIHAIAIVRLRTPRHDPLAKRRRFIWLVLARVLHEQGDLDAVVDLELVEEAGDVGLDRGDGEVQLRGDLGVRLATADGEGDVVLAWAERGHAVAGSLGAGAGVGVAGHHGDEPACDRGGEHAVAGVDELDRADDFRRRGVLQEEAGCSGLQRAQDELVGVEGREDDDGGPVQVDRAEHLAAVRGFGDHVDVRGAGEHDPQAGAHERVVVDEQDADHRGRLARRTNAPPGSTPCSSVPPASETRSARPIRPVFVSGSGAAAATATGARLRTSTCRSPSGARRVRVTAAPGACLRALVRPSCAMRYAVRPTAAGAAASPSSIRVVTRIPAPRDSSTRAARSASVGWGGCVGLSPPSSRRTPITLRSSSSAVFALSRITPAASATSSAAAFWRNSSAPAWTESSERRWA